MFLEFSRLVVAILRKSSPQLLSRFALHKTSPAKASTEDKKEVARVEQEEQYESDTSSTGEQQANITVALRSSSQQTDSTSYAAQAKRK